MHYSVLKKEVLEALRVKPNGRYVDGTLGRGGYAQGILQSLETGFLYAFDLDQEAIDYCQELLGTSALYTLIHQNYTGISELEGNFDGVVLDLGVSSPQFDNPFRGFSYHHDTPLDMRMDQEGNQLTAADIVNTYSESALTKVFFDYGEEYRFGRAVAKAIVKYRQDSVIKTTGELVEIIKRVIPAHQTKSKHPARTFFQALRIEVNQELTSLETALHTIIKKLSIGGRLLVVSFHSLEDRIVKQVFRQYTRIIQNKRLPQSATTVSFQTFPIIYPSEEEIAENRRSRSAKLRIIERIK